MFTALSIGDNSNNGVDTQMYWHKQTILLPIIMTSIITFTTDGTQDPSFLVDAVFPDLYLTWVTFQRFIGIAMPYYVTNGQFARFPISRTGRGKMILFSVVHPSVLGYPNGCDYTTMWAIDIFASHQNQFYADIMLAKYNDAVSMNLVFAVAESEASVGQLGSENHHL